MQQAGTNWAGNIAYGSSGLLSPRSVDEVQEIVRAAARVRALGSRHCFNTIADTSGTHISLQHLKRMVRLDRAAGRVTVEGGIRYGDLGPLLDAAGYALHNLASLPHISVAGACATATHGSGAANGNLATAVTAITFVDAAGELVTLSREADGDTFAGAVVNLGGLGVIVALTLEVQPAFEMRQDVYTDLPLAALAARFDEIMASGYRVSLFTDWRGDTVNQVWLKRKVDAGDAAAAPSSLPAARPATTNRHPLDGHDPVNCTGQMGVPGPWYERLPHFRMDFTPSGGEEIQAEYFVAREHALAAVDVLRHWGDRLAPLLMVSEVRTVAADDLWMSPCYRQPCVAFHFSFERNWPALQRLLPGLEAALAPFHPRPHWGKVFTLPAAEVQARYAKLPAFRALLAAHDPGGKFRNAFVDEMVFGEA